MVIEQYLIYSYADRPKLDFVYFTKRLPLEANRKLEKLSTYEPKVCVPADHVRVYIMYSNDLLLGLLIGCSSSDILLGLYQWIYLCIYDTSNDTSNYHSI